MKIIAAFEDPVGFEKTLARPLRPSNSGVEFLTQEGLVRTSEDH
jgi:hypothetical protein